MKKLTIILLALSAGILAGAAVPVERIYVSTDRDVYIAGDAVWCSLTSLDGNGRYSNESAVSYLELVSEGGAVCTAKIGLLEGRGAGSFRIPVTTPTGTYRLVAYTAVNAGEEGTPWMAGSRLLTVFNTTSSARIPNGVEILDEQAYEALPRPVTAPEGQLQLSTRTRLPRGTASALVLSNAGPKASVSLSVRHEDDLLPAAKENTPASFLKALPAGVRLKPGANPVTEFDGEIVSARIKGALMDDADSYAEATLSTAGDPASIYVGRAEGSDRIRYYTSNIYGNREIVCEVSKLDKEGGYIDFESPFFHPAAGELPKLRLSPSLRQDLVSRKSALRAEKALRIDTLTTFMTHRKDLILESNECRRYHLDDYTRFPSVQEILVEFIPELSARRIRDRWILQLVISDAVQSRYEKTNNVLVMMDGVILSDLDLLMGFDAMLLEDIDIYMQTFVCGKVPFHGMVNFITKKNYVTALHFPANVRVVDFQGVAYPVAYNGAVPEGEGQDLRQLLYWHPILNLDAGSDYRLEFTTPGYSGRFKAVAEGFTEDGQPIYQEFAFEVE